MHISQVFKQFKFNCTVLTAQLLSKQNYYLFLTRGYAKRRNVFLLGLRYANVSLAHSGVESS